MYFDSTLWAMTRGVRLRMLACGLCGLLGLAAGIARFALFGQFLAQLFANASGSALWGPLAGAAAAILLRGIFEHALNLLANRNAARIQNTLRAQLYDKIVELGPAWFGGQRTGGVMLAVIDGVEQQIGRASCRERVCHDVYISGAAGLHKKHIHNNQNA